MKSEFIVNVKACETPEQLLGVLIKHSVKSPGRSVRAHQPELYELIQGDNSLPEAFTENLYLRLHPGAGTCYCGVRTKFISLRKGYRAYCSIKCSTNASARKDKERESKENIDWQEISEKRKQTNRLRYGHECNLHSPLLREQVRERLRQRSEITLERIKTTNQLRYGVDWITQSPKLIDASKDYHANAWGERYGSLLLDQAAKLNFTILSNLDKKPASVTLKHNDCGTTFAVPYPFSFACPTCNVKGSAVERDIATFIEKLGISIERNDRTIIKPLELDIVIPERKVAIEVNGVYWHREQPGKRTLLEKTESCERAGFRLIHIWDYEWINKRQMIENFLMQLLTPEKAVGARKLKLIEHVSYNEARTFCEQHHRQGWAQAKYRIGLQADDELVCLLTAGKPRFSKKAKLEIVRFCAKARVSGGFKRVLKELLRQAGSSTIITYADRRWNTGEMYEAAGFTKIGNTPPGYFYCNSRLEIKTRYECQLNRLPHLLQERFNPALTERENMSANGYWRCEDAGNAIYLLS